MADQRVSQLQEALLGDFADDAILYMVLPSNQSRRGQLGTLRSFLGSQFISTIAQGDPVLNVATIDFQNVQLATVNFTNIQNTSFTLAHTNDANLDQYRIYLQNNAEITMTLPGNFNDPSVLLVPGRHLIFNYLLGDNTWLTETKTIFL